MSRLGNNLRQLAALAVDSLPAAWVRGERYRTLRRRLSRTPGRYEIKERALPFTPGQWRERNLAGPETDLVVDGFPGSANSFLSNAIRRATLRPARIESHFHYTAQLKRARENGVPLVVLARSPDPACDSFKAKSPGTWDWLIVVRWLHYYGYVERSHGGIDLVFFDDVVDDVDSVRRGVPAVDRLVGRPLDGDPQLRRRTTEPCRIDPTRPFAGWLLRRARARYRRLVERRRET